MRAFRESRGFSLIELLVAVAITLVLAGIMLSVTTGTLNVWRRTQDNFSTSTQSKLVLDYLERDFQSALFRKDGQTWLAVDVINAASALTNHGWQIASAMKPATLDSQRLDGVDRSEPSFSDPSRPAPAIADARFGLSGVWLRFVTTNVETEGSLPVAVSYQIARRPVSGTNIGSSNLADVRYTLFRSSVKADATFASGCDVLAADYGSAQQNPQVTRSASTLTNPNNSDAIATNVVDFGVWLYVRDATGALLRIYPTDKDDVMHAAKWTTSSDTAAQFPVVADVMVRILTEEGAKLVEAMEQGSGALRRPDNFATDEAWWWSVVETHSRVAVRRVEVKGGSL